ncbi:MAG: hypothetical protein ACLTAI_03465 [Thomasclavelia sp.]
MDSIYIDVKKAAEEIVDRYLAKGKDDIVYILPKQNLIKSDEIIEGIKETYKKYDKGFAKQNQILLQVQVIMKILIQTL